MRNWFMSLALGAVCLGATLAMPAAGHATPLGASGIAAVKGEAGLTEQVRYVCRPVRMHSHGRVWWSERCSWRSGHGWHHRGMYRHHHGMHRGWHHRGHRHW